MGQKRMGKIAEIDLNTFSQIGSRKNGVIAILILNWHVNETEWRKDKNFESILDTEENEIVRLTNIFHIVYLRD